MTSNDTRAERMKTYIIRDTLPCYVTFLYRMQAKDEHEALEAFYESQSNYIGSEVGETISFMGNGHVEAVEEAA